MNAPTYQWRTAADKRLRKALRGGFGYAAQKDAWDAVMPAWPAAIKLVNHHGHRRLSDADHAFLHQITGWLRADNGRLLRCWYQLMMQDLYRSCPGLGGWFPA